MPSTNDRRNSAEAAKRMPDTPCGAIAIDCPKCRFDLDVGLIGNDDGGILTPLKVPAYRELDSGTTKSLDFVEFKLEIKQNAVTRLTLEIYTEHPRNTLYLEELGPEYLGVGSHKWRWDGYSNSGILDTVQLKDPSLTLEATAELCQERKSKKLKLHNSSAEEDWVDVRIDRGAKTIAATIRVKLDDNGDHGVGEMAPTSVQNGQLYKSLATGDVATKPHLRLRTYEQLKILFHQGIGRYWSRKIDVLGYWLTANSVEAKEKHMDDIGIKYNTNAHWMRSSNPGSVRGFISLGAQVIPERVIYNVGWIRSENSSGKIEWEWVTDASADQEFSHSAAHELGHEILSAYGGAKYSYGHRGSSTVTTQKTKDPSHGGEYYPQQGEIDLMKYYNGVRPKDFFSQRSVAASEVDAQSLIWLARVKFR